MKALILHHSSVMLTIENENIRDPEGRKLAGGIIRAQKKEMVEIIAILARME
jgi:uncharacterized protein (DUF305 family)